MNGARRWAAIVTGCCAAVALVPGSAWALVLDVRPFAATSAGVVLFPNWSAAEGAAFDVVWCASAECPGATDATLAGLTVLNFGTAAPADLAAVAWRTGCTTETGPMPMTYAGLFAVDGGTYPAWTWMGAVALDPDPCAACSCRTTLRIEVDVAGCAAHGGTVVLGIGTSGGGAAGGLSDALGGTAPAAEVRGVAKTIVHAMTLADRAEAVPGETVSYSVYYGRPGTADLASITVLGTLPPYTHLVEGSVVPPPDAFWNPDPGPPARLRWTIPGPLAVAGGATGVISFQATVDWGNEPFDPGSGAFAAPEGADVAYAGHALFAGGGCAPNGAVARSAPVRVDRILVWQETDNDLAFSPNALQGADEVTYSLEVVNRSATRSLARATLWDSIPADLDAWAPGCGILDPCVGGTMTPTGCVAAGRVTNGGVTLLTWSFGLPPGASQVFRWRGRVRSSALPGASIVNTVSVAAAGATGLQGSGASGPPTVAVHALPVVERRTVVGYSAFQADTSTGSACPGWALVFYPLHKGTDIELRGLELSGSGYASSGGVSPSIGCLLGTCAGGFPGDWSCSLGSGAVSGGGEAGCGASRAPARYLPSNWYGTCPPLPMTALYKATAGSPFLWATLSLGGSGALDNHLYLPTTALTYSGMTAYTFLRSGSPPGGGRGDSLTIMNTGVDAAGVTVPGLATSVYVFRWQPDSARWALKRSLSLGAEAQHTITGTSLAGEGHYRLVSTGARIIARQGYNAFDTVASASHAAMAPLRETGGVMSSTGAGNFYLVVAAAGSAGAAPPVAAVTNLGAGVASYKVWRYESTVSGASPVPFMLGEGTGMWRVVGTASVPPGFGAAGNPALHGSAGLFAAPSTALFKVELTGGGQVQVLHGNGLAATGSGAAFLDARGGGPAGGEFWYSQTGASGGAAEMGALLALCPAQGTVVACVSDDGFSSAYTTGGPDQAVMFKALTDAPVGSVRNWKLTAAGGSVLAMFSHAGTADKGYASPVIGGAPSYRVTAPAVAYAGQPLWITVTALDASGGVDAAYSGISAFTSGDPGAVMQGAPMGSFTYAWTGGEAGVRTFGPVTFSRPGTWGLLATDASDGVVTGMAVVVVVSAEIKVTSQPELQSVSSGEIAQFRICWSNYSAATASGYTVTDAIPDGTVYVPDAPSNHWCEATNGFGAATVSYSTTTAFPNAFATMTGPATTAVRYLRWTIPAVGVATTGCVCFRVTVK